MRLFITGATGFIGAHFVKRAVAGGHEVIGHRRGASSRPHVNATPTRWTEKPLGALIASDFAGVDVVVHLAAFGVSPQPATWEECFRVNVVESLAMASAAIDAGVDRIVVAGTSAEYGLSGQRYEAIPADAPLEPMDPYAASKAASSVAFGALARSRKAKLIYQRVFTVYGEGQFEKNFFPSLRRAALAGEDFPMTPGDQVRDFIAVEAVADRLLEACGRQGVEPGNPVFENVGSGRPQSLRAFAEERWREMGATGALLVGAIAHRPGEVMRYVPALTPIHGGA